MLQFTFSGIKRALIPAMSAALLATGMSVVGAQPADAAPMLGTRIVREAAAQRGKPYKWGATGPRAFDCSGLVKYVAAKQRRNLPRTARAQYRAVRKISKRAARPGDLVFFLKRGVAYHVGIYAGGGKMWHAPKAGDHVRLARIWTSAWQAGRIG